MPQLDFNVAFSNFLFLIFFFIFFYMLVYFFIFPRLFKMILVRKFYFHKLETTKATTLSEARSRRFNNFVEFKKILSFSKNIT